MLIEFKGMMYDTECYYITERGHLVRPTHTEGTRLYFAGTHGCIGITYRHLDTFDIAKIAIPEKKKITPEKGKVYKVSIWERGEIYYLEFDGTHFRNDETRLHHSLTIVLAEMKEV